MKPCLKLFFNFTSGSPIEFVVLTSEMGNNSKSVFSFYGARQAKPRGERQHMGHAFSSSAGRQKEQKPKDYLPGHLTQRVKLWHASQIFSLSTD